MNNLKIMQWIDLIIILVLSVLLIVTILPGCKKSTAPPDDVPPDTTTHNYEWTVQQFGTGAGSSYLYDVFAISKDDVWAVGKITTNQQDSLGNDLDPYNAIHWDGQNWELRWIETEYRGDMIAPPLEGIYAFSPTDMWATSGIPQHWNGLEWTLYHLWDMGILAQGDGGVPNIWGTSSSNLYFAGRKGSLVHYDGSDWTKLDSGTDLRLTDICGFEDGNFAIVGSNSATNENIFIVKKDNNSTQFEYDTNRKKGIWGTDINNIYAVGAGLFHFNGDTLIMIQWPNNIPQIFVESLRGTASNNIFASGHFSFIMHFNGKSWYYYEDLYGDANLYAISVLEDEVFAVGADGYNAYIYHGKKK